VNNIIQFSCGNSKGWRYGRSQIGWVAPKRRECTRYASLKQKRTAKSSTSILTLERYAITIVYLSIVKKNCIYITG